MAFERLKKFFGMGPKVKEEIALPIEEASAAKRDPKKVAVKTLGTAFVAAKGTYEQPVYIIDDIIRAYNTDSYAKRAVDKYSELMFKAGWEISGKNTNASDYVWSRLKFMEEATGQSIDEFLMQIAFDLVLFGNAFIVKQRKGQIPPGLKAQGYTGNQPVLGYFILSPLSITISRDASGAVLGYKQQTSAGITEFKPEDFIHFYYKKPTGRAFGTPMIYQAVDDIKLLRQIEENIARLIYRNLFPLYQYQVGLDKPGFEATDEEIENIREQIRNMPMDGGIVVPERHNITVVSDNGSALDASGYLAYFRERVFAGLGVSDVVMGIGNTSNRSTADNLSADLIDGVKEFQRIFKATFTTKIVHELLFEGGFDPIANPDDEVEFVFEEIELDAKIKKENHLVQMFTQNAITHDEMRQMMGLDPVMDESRLFVNMIGGATALHAANGQAAVAGVQNAIQQKTQAANNAGNNKNQPANQHGKNMSPGKPGAANKAGGATKASWEVELTESVNENTGSMLTESDKVVTLLSELNVSKYENDLKQVFSSLRQDMADMYKAGKPKEYVKAFAIEAAKRKMNRVSKKWINNALLFSISQLDKNFGKSTPAFAASVRAKELVKKTDAITNRLLDDVASISLNAMESDKDVVAKIAGVFNSNEYRIGFLAKTEILRAYNYGRALSAKNAGQETVTMQTHDSCDLCKMAAKKPIDLTTPELLDAVPPHHANCTCTIQLNKSDKEV